MARKKAQVYILTALFLAVAVFFGLRDRENQPYLSFELMAEGGTEQIQIWDRGDGAGYVFLPSYAKMAQVRVHSGGRPALDGRILTYGMTCEELQPDTPYQVSDLGQLHTLTFLTTQNLPALYIDTASGSMDQIHASKENREKGSYRLYEPDGKQNAQGKLNIKCRGNSTFHAEKKPYSLELSSGKNLLGMGKAKKWILLANSRDDTNLRNKIVYDFAAEAGLPFSPESQWVDLYLNGEYAGLYLLSERVEVDGNRVDIEKKKGFLLSSEAQERMDEQQLPYIKTQGGVALRIHHSGLKEQELLDLWQSAGRAIRTPEGVDPETGKHWSEWIDTDSWIRKYLIEEIFGNIDGGRYSQFYFLDPDKTDGKICAGPVWDYDLAMSNPTIYWEAGLARFEDRFFRAFYVNTNPEAWFHWLYKNEDFRVKLEEIYTRDFTPLLKKLIQKEIGRYESQIASSARMNQIRWDTGDFLEEVQALSDCIRGRTEFLTRVWTEHEAYLWITARYLDRNIGYALKPGETLSQIPQYEDYTWYISGTDTPLDPFAPVYEDLEVELRLGA